jgi:hypothetical protein
VDVVLETDGQSRHELCTRGDAVAVKVRGLWFDGRELAPTALKVLTDTHDLIVFLTGEQKMDHRSQQLSIMYSYLVYY